MSQLRRLVKPGGYLLLLEITNNDPLRFGFIFGGLPGWWLGYDDDGRVYSPCVGLEKWDEVMRKTGFSGADVVTPHHALGPLSVIMTQAVDDRVHLLRQSLSTPGFSIDSENLTIIGGAPSLVKALQNLLQPYYKQVSLISSIEEVRSEALPVMGSVLSLIELYSPLYKNITARRLEGFKQIFQQSKSVYWVSQGASGENPYANMVTGIGRTIVLEMRHFRLGFLDFSRADYADAQRVAEKLLQFEIAATWDPEPLLEGMTWYRESELRFDDGMFLIPRIRLSKSRNKRYNSKRRLLVEEVDAQSLPVTLTTSGESQALQQISGSVCAENRADTVVLTISYAVLRSVRLRSEDYLFLVLGTDNSTGKPLFALKDAQKSIIEVDRQWTVPCSTTLTQGMRTLVSIYKWIIAHTVVEGLTFGDSLVVLNADRALSAALSSQSAEKGVRLTELTTRADLERRGAAYVHPLTPKRDLERVLPPKVSRFLNFSNDSGLDEDAAQLIIKCLPSKCQYESLESLTDNVAYVTTTTLLGIESTVSTILRACWAHDKTGLQTIYMHDPPMVTGTTPMDLVESNTVPSGLCLVDWAATAKVVAQIQPADSIVRFKHDKTYWLVGLTGGLGLSLCRWMVDRGARYVVMTSRNPSIDLNWLESIEALGVKVKIFPR